MKRLCASAVIAAMALVSCSKKSGVETAQAAQETAYANLSAEGSNPALPATSQPVAFQTSSFQAGAFQAGGAPTPGNRRTRNLLRFEPAVIVDATGFDKPMGAATMFIPHGWRTEGGVFWARDFMCTNGYNFMWSASSPDGAMSLGIAPQTAWSYATGAAPASPRPGCPVLQISSARQYLEESVRKALPDARILDYRDRPDLVGEIGFQPQRIPNAMGEMQRWAEGGEVLYAFSRNGRDMRGVMAAVVQFDRMITDMTQIYATDPTIVQMPDQGAMRMEQVSAFAHSAFFASAPNGQLKPSYFEAMRRTLKPNPQWAAKITNHNLRIGAVAIEEGRKRADMINRSNAEIARIREETWNAYQESSDRRVREFGEAIRGVETYADADAPGGQVELSHSWDHAWRLNDGSYVLTDDPYFDPWRDLQMEGRQLEAVR